MFLFWLHSESFVLGAKTHVAAWSLFLGHRDDPTTSYPNAAVDTKRLSAWTSLDPRSKLAPVVGQGRWNLEKKYAAQPTLLWVARFLRSLSVNYVLF